MPLDILGPGSNTPNVTTSRPADDAEYGVNDTWFKDCTSPEAQDGTKIKASILNRTIAQLRRAIRGMGITENNTDDDMLLKAIQKAGSTSTVINQFIAYLPMFPEIQTETAKFALTTSTGQIVINAGQTWVHRGAFQKSTDEYDLSARTFVTVANKTYHLRWKWNGPSISPSFHLFDLSDSGYNTAAAPETHPKFDSTYDDMLIARIVTNGANALTVTPLVNRMRLSQDVSNENYINTSVVSQGVGGVNTVVMGPTAAHATAVVSPLHTLDWSRQPKIEWHEFRGEAGDSAPTLELPPGAPCAVHFKANRYQARPVVHVHGGISQNKEGPYYANLHA